MSSPPKRPIGLHLAQTAKTVSRAFDTVLSEAGGSLPAWLVLLSLKTHQAGNQRELADAVGIRGATLTHHLNTMEREGLLTRRRDPNNRRIHKVELTQAGEAYFQELRSAALDFDKRLRNGFNSQDIAVLEQLLERLQQNVTR